MEAKEVKPQLLADTGHLIYEVREADRELFDRKLRSWMPPDSFDAHAHFYDLGDVYPHLDKSHFRGPMRVGFEAWRRMQTDWMGDRIPSGGLFFAFPVAHLDTARANDVLFEEIKGRAQLRGLLMIRPNDDPAEIQRQVVQQRWSGFKVYHVFANRPNTFDASTDEFLPEWAWEVANELGLAIMLHMVRARALADELNQTYIRSHCLRYPNARLILAHAARGFCGAHTVEGISSLRGLSNVWFDTSAICEPQPIEAILREFGPSRLLYGSDFTISEMHARPVSLGDGFYWLYEHNVDWSQWKHGRLPLCGIESLLAVQQACRTCLLRDGDIERIFSENARQLLNVEPFVGESAEKTQVTAGGGVQASRGDSRGQELYRRAKEIIPGGTQLLSKRPEQFAPGTWPPYYIEARGCEVIDLDGRQLLDFTLNGIGACLLGFGHPHVTSAVMRRVSMGSMSTLNSPEEVELAERLIAMHPWSEQARFARCGGEAMAIAVRIVRAATRRELIAFCGYHGWCDWYLAANLGELQSLDGHLLPGLRPLGVPRGLHGTVLPFAYNQIDQLREIVREHGPALAAVVMEPTRHTEPRPGFLEGVRQLCDSVGAKLVFDEVSTGFRFHRGGAHLKFGIKPDMAVFAKSLGNGHPIAAVIGRSDTMQAAQESFISSTYWTEGVGYAAALATLDVFESTDVPRHVAAIGERFRQGIAQVAAEHKLPLRVAGYPAMTSISFEGEDAAALMTLFTTRMLDHGFLAGAGFYPTLAHEDRQVDLYLAAADQVFAELVEARQKGDVLVRINGQVKHSGFARLT